MSDTLQASELITAKKDLELRRRPLFGLPAICEVAEGKRQEPDFDEVGDGIWGTLGSRVFGWEYDCQIRSIENGIADLHCDMGDYGVWDDRLRWEETQDTIRVAQGTDFSVELQRCPSPN